MMRGQKPYSKQQLSIASTVYAVYSTGHLTSPQTNASDSQISLSASYQSLHNPSVKALLILLVAWKAQLHMEVCSPPTQENIEEKEDERNDRKMENPLSYLASNCCLI